MPRSRAAARWEAVVDPCGGFYGLHVADRLRLGYAVLPEDLVQPFVAARYLADRHSSGLLHGIMTEFILDGHFARHLKRMRADYH